jgi:hypothetical protein
MDTRAPELLLEALTVERANIEDNQTLLGFSAADVTGCIQDYGNLSAALANVGIADADKQSVTKVKTAVYSGDAGESIQPYPSFALTALPFPLVKAGALSRYTNRKGRAKLAAGYTEQIGAAMGYADAKEQSIGEAEVKPSIEAFAAAVGYLFSLIVTARAKAAMWEVQLQRKGSDTWQTVMSATGKSADITITPTTPGAAEQILVRVILKKDNQIYGQPSDPVYVTVSP